MKSKITKRNILSYVNSIYDPLGLLSPFTVKAKIILRKIWVLQPKCDWDDDLPDDIKNEWNVIYSEIPQLRIIKFNRSLTPPDICGLPTLIIFSDGPKVAYGAVAYCRWRIKKNSFKSCLIMAKCRIAPLKTVGIVRLELCGVVVNKRLRSYIEKEMQLQFERVYHMVDSEVVKAMIEKESYGFNTFIANRVGEIQQTTSPKEWI